MHKPMAHLIVWEKKRVWPTARSLFMMDGYGAPSLQKTWGTSWLRKWAEQALSQGYMRREPTNLRATHRGCTWKAKLQFIKKCRFSLKISIWLLAKLVSRKRRTGYLLIKKFFGNQSEWQVRADEDHQLLGITLLPLPSGAASVPMSLTPMGPLQGPSLLGNMKECQRSSGGSGSPSSQKPRRAARTTPSPNASVFHSAWLDTCRTAPIRRT